jgi:hypothetical protein
VEFCSTAFLLYIFGKTGVLMPKFYADICDLPELMPETGSVFAQDAWLQATAHAMPHALKLVRVFRGDSLRLILPLQIIKKGPFIKAFTPILSNYGGPYRMGETRLHFNEDLRLQRQLNETLLKFLESQFHYSLIAPDAMDHRMALESGWKVLPRYTVECDLLKQKEYCTDARRMIKKAEKSNLSFGPEQDDSLFEEAYVRTFSSKGLGVPYDPNWVTALKTGLTKRGLLQNYTIRNAENKEIAFASVIPDEKNKNLILWYACSLPEADRTGAMYLLISGLIEEYTGSFNSFDIGGVDHGSLAGFKEHFADRLVVRHSAEYFRGSLIKAGMQAYTGINRILK